MHDIVHSIHAFADTVAPPTESRRCDAVECMRCRGAGDALCVCVCVCERSIGLIACVQLDVLSDYDAVRLHGRTRDVALLGAFSGHL